MPTKLSKYVRPEFHTVWLISLLLLYFILNVIPFAIYGFHPLGYDTGFYRRYLINPNISFLNSPVPGLDHTIIAPRIFLDLARFLGFGPDITLYGSYIFLIFIFAIIFYLFIKEYTDENTALIALALLVFSSVQYLAYWFMFYKNFFGLIFFFLVFIFLKKKMFLSALICALIIPISHQTTAIMLLAIIGVYLLLYLIFEKKILIPELIILILTLFVYLYLHPHVQQKISAPPVGVFLEKTNFLLMSLPLIIFTLIGLTKFLNLLKKNFLLIAFGGISIIFPLLSLPYYPRVFLFTHYWLIIGAAIGARGAMLYAVNKKPLYRFAIIVATGLFIFHSVLLVNQIFKLKPLITKKTMIEIEKLKENTPDKAYVLTTPRLTPWVQGWSTAKVYAPGILKDQHSSREWQIYLASPSNEKLAFLNNFPKPLYIFVDDSLKNMFVPNVSCVLKLSDMLYFNKC